MDKLKSNGFRYPLNRIKYREMTQTEIDNEYAVINGMYGSEDN